MNTNKPYNPIIAFKELVPHHTITPHDITKILNAEGLHKRGITGKGITVGIIDSGWYEHPYFKLKRDGYKKKTFDERKEKTNGWEKPSVIHEIHAVHRQTDEEYTKKSKAIKEGEIDPSENSHGTGMVANIYAIAPEITLKVYSKMVGASFKKQVERALEECDILSFSAAQDPRTFEVMYRDSYKDLFLGAKKIIIYCIGNTGRVSWPVQNCQENMVVVGGVYQHENQELQAANYASATKDFLPDICGLCGMVGEKGAKDKYPDENYFSGQYIWLPADPQHAPLIANKNGNLEKAGKVYREKGEYEIVKKEVKDSKGNYSYSEEVYYKSDNGITDKDYESAKVYWYGTEGPARFPPSWNLASGTSSATPQVAGVVALMLQSRRELGYRDLTIHEIRAILRSTAEEVTAGNSYDGFPAATKNGQKKWCLLVNAEAAVEKAVSERKEFVETL